ncbi:MAG: HNH endonuclease [Hahellaceae bacterium]|nr:HNH endonuclease [Hahellaceae bacterium]
MPQTSPLILKITRSGQPQTWVTSERAAIDLCCGKVAWSFGVSGITLRGGVNALGVRSELRIPSIIATRNESRCYHESIPFTRHNLFARDRWTCMYCGQGLPLAKLTVDHILPTSRGGRHVWQNTISACFACNHRKADRTPEEANMALLGVPYIPNRFEYLYLKNRHILADQMDFLAKGFRNLRP